MLRLLAAAALLALACAPAHALKVEKMDVPRAAGHARRWRIKDGSPNPRAIP